MSINPQTANMHLRSYVNMWISELKYICTHTHVIVSSILWDRISHSWTLSIFVCTDFVCSETQDAYMKMHLTGPPNSLCPHMNTASSQAYCSSSLSVTQEGKTWLSSKHIISQMFSLLYFWCPTLSQVLIISKLSVTFGFISLLLILA